MKYVIFLLLILVAGIANAQEDNYVSLQDRLKSNIFLKVDASSTDCFVGEPIVVTYKLYSALATESSIIKSPVFDGFDIRDLKGNADHMASRETVDGIKFDVHTLLKLQLTPRRPGKLTLGALTVQNRVKLVDANGKEDPLLNDVKEGYTLTNGYFILPVSSVPITVLATALPGSSLPAAQQFSGRVGDFKMDVQVSKTVLAPGEQAELTISLSGRGDFSIIEAPEIAWPDAADVLATRVDEDKSARADGSGYKAFVIPFSINAPGRYIIPAIRFSFFDAQSNRYKTITNIPVALSVINEEGASDNPVAATGENNPRPYLWAGLALAALIVALIAWKKRQRAKRSSTRNRQWQAASSGDTGKNINSRSMDITVDEALRLAVEKIHEPGGHFSLLLKQGILRYLQSRWNLPQPYNQDALLQAMNDKNLTTSFRAELRQLLATIDMNIYSGGGTDTDRETLLNTASALLQQV